MGLVGVIAAKALTDRAVLRADLDDAVEEIAELRVEADEAIKRSQDLWGKLEMRTAERDRWVRLFNRLEKACSDAIDRNPDDDALVAAHRAVMREAARRD